MDAGVGVIRLNVQNNIVFLGVKFEEAVRWWLLEKIKSEAKIFFSVVLFLLN